MKTTEISQVEYESQDFQRETFALDVLTGFCTPRKSLSPKYFYDDYGSELFQKITQHPDYYPTKTEFNILKNISNTLAENISEKEIDIIELGAGDGHKTELLIDGFLKQNTKVNFYPIDISLKAMDLLEENITPHPNLTIHGVVGEYFEGLRFVKQQSKNKQLVLCLGSNIGNFNHAQIQGFLRKLWKSLDHRDHVLIGFDLKKGIKILSAAYNDSDGLTSEFNLNILRRINNELGGQFNLDLFEHFGTYNPILGAMESYLLSKVNQEVYIAELQRSFFFKAYEAIHLEYSFKFLKSEIDDLGENTGFEIIKHYSDEKDYFLDSHWKVLKQVKSFTPGDS